MSRRILPAFAVLLVLSLSTCDTETTPKPTPTPKPSLYELEYLLLDAYPETFFCDPDFYPVGAEGWEERHSIEQFPSIRANTEEFAAILGRLELPDKSEYSAEEKLAIYREHKKLTYAIRTTSTQSGYDFGLHTSGEADLCVEGSIAYDGTVRESTRKTCYIDCPICLTKGTVIDTPAGPVAVQEITTGDWVWTVDESGRRTEARVIEAGSTPVPADWEVAKVTLADGRSVTASPGHPTADRRPLGDYRVGDLLHGALVVAVERVRYAGGFTYDILPAGPTGAYWANDVLLSSTLTKSKVPSGLP